MARYPRAIILLINKMPDKLTMQKIKNLGNFGAEILSQNSKFDPNEVDRIERLCAILGRAHDLIN